MYKKRNIDSFYCLINKLDKTEKIALDQIMKKEYYKAYEHASKQIVLVGANIESETRRLAGWESKEF